MFDQNFANEDSRRIIFGGVQFVKTQVANLARLRWDRKRVDAMAVDGQHRLKALKLWFDQKNKELTEIEKPTRISVIFLLLHKDAGFERSVEDNTDSIKGIAREIFTDLNKNAKEVDQATQIVLDDRSLESRCVRALVTASTCEDSETLIPLSLLRWRETNNRFDQRYYLNSLVNLHLVVNDLLGLQVPRDPMHASDVRKYIKRLEENLGDPIEGERVLLHDGKSLSKAYESDFFDPEWGAHDASKALLDLMTKSATTIDLALGEKEQDGTLSGVDLDKKKRQVGKDRLIALLSKCWLPQDGIPHVSLKDDDDMI